MHSPPPPEHFPSYLDHWQVMTKSNFWRYREIRAPTSLMRPGSMSAPSTGTAMLTQALRFVIDMWDAADRIRDRGPQRLCREVARVWIERTGVHLEEDSAWQETVALAESVLTAHGNDPGRQLAAFLDRLSPAFQPGGVAMSTATPQGPALTLTTLERARGREWEAVFVIGSPGQLVPVDPETAYDRRKAEAMPEAPLHRRHPGEAAARFRNLQPTR